MALISKASAVINFSRDTLARLETILQAGEYLLDAEPADRAKLHEKLAIAYLSFSNLDNDLMDQVIDHFNIAVDLTPIDDPNKPMRHHNLGYFLRLRFEESKDMKDLNQALCHHRSSLDLVLGDHSDKCSMHFNLGISLLLLFEQLRNIEDLHQALRHSEITIDLIPSHHSYLIHHGKPSTGGRPRISSLTHFERRQNVVDIHQFTHYFKRIADLLPIGHLDSSVVSISIGKFFHYRFQALGNTDDIHEAVCHYNRAIGLMSKDHSDKPLCHHALGNSLLSRFRQLQDSADLHEAVRHYNCAVELASDEHPDKPLYYNSLGTSFYSCFKQLGNINDLHGAISSYNCAVDLAPEGYPDKPLYCISLGNSFQLRFKHLGNIDDLHQAFHHHNRAMEMTPKGHLNKYLCHNALGNSFHSRFKQLGNIDDLRQALRHHRHAMRLTSGGHPDKPLCHNALGNSLYTRFKQLGHIDDLNEANYHHNCAVISALKGHPDIPLYWHSLGNSLHSRFEQLRNVDDLHEAIKCYECALALMPVDHPDGALLNNSLGHSYYSLQCKQQYTCSIYDAIHHYSYAVQNTPDGYASKPSYLIDLGHAFYYRFQQLDMIVDLDQSISQHQLALSLAPISHSHTPSMLLSLSQLFSIREHTGDLITAIFLCISAAQHTHVTPGTHFEATEQCIKYLHQLHGQVIPSVLDIYNAVIQQLPQLTCIDVSTLGYLNPLMQAATLGSDAAAVALSANKPELSLVWLEHSRSVLWWQILQMCPPLGSLSESYPNLATHMINIWTKIKEGRSLSSFEQHVKSSTEFNQLIVQIRAQPCFSHFLLPKECSELQIAALSGPIIMLNASQHRCDAFIILSSSIQIVPLDLCNLKQIQDYQYLFNTAFGNRFSCGKPFIHTPSMLPWGDDISDTLNFLWTCVVSPCLVVLKQLMSSNMSSSMHIRWCPTGPFNCLPIHAATEFGANYKVLQCLLDNAVSSYIPTLSSLLEPKCSSNIAVDCKALAVIQHHTSGQQGLSNVELQTISQHMLKANIVFDSISSDATTVDAVLAKIPEYSVVHFDCDSILNYDSPLSSGLQLHDNCLTLSKLRSTKLPNAQLAFISTGTTTAKSEEEDPPCHINTIIHSLEAGMLTAGFRDIITVMGNNCGISVSAIVDHVYGEIFEDGKLHIDKIAVALHHAVQNLRDQNPDDFMSWIPFIHIGP